jgi:serine/threonine-protein kinase
MTSTHDGQPSAALPQPDPEHIDVAALRTLCEADDLFRARYEGWDELGPATGSTVVVRTHQRDVGLPVALKVIWRLSTAERRRARAEAQALMRVQHPCVLRTYSLFDRGGLSWLEMELVEGPTLEQALRDGMGGPAWTLRRRLEVGACVAEGLGAVHAAGFVHRDVKPANVLLPRTGPAAKLADFGVSRATDATLLLGEGLPGSPRFASPEALRGEPCGPAADVYALALTLYELFSGGLSPYGLGQSASLAEVLRCHRDRAPLPLRVLGLGLPDEVVDAIHAGLDKRPDRRPSAAAMASVLWAAQREAGGPSVPGARPARGWARVRAWAWAWASRSRRSGGQARWPE